MSTEATAPHVLSFPSAANRKIEAEKFIRILSPAGSVHEGRILGASNRSKRIDSGFFNDPVKAASQIVEHDGLHNPKGCYITVNPVKPAMLAHANNKVKDYAETTTNDSNVLQRLWI